MINFKEANLVKLKKINPDEIIDDIAKLFVTGEEVVGAYKGIRDYIAFTNKRIIAADLKGMTGKKRDYTTLPYSKIQAFSIETAGLLDVDSELELYFNELGKISIEFTGQSDIVRIGQIIGENIL